MWDPVRLIYLALVVLVASVAMISLMFLVMVRVDDPLVPRAIFGVLNMLLFFPSGAVYPTEAFPPWLRWISVIDPFTYTVHALRNLTLKNTGIEGIYMDVLILTGFSAVMIAGSMALVQAPTVDSTRRSTWDLLDATEEHPQSKLRRLSDHALVFRG